MRKVPTYTHIKGSIIKIKETIYNNPKTFYKYSMITLIIFFVFSTIKEIYYPSKYFESTQVPQIQRKSEQEIKVMKKEEKDRERESKEILDELQALGKKRDNNSLTQADSIRAQFLMNKYNKINNGGF